MHSCEGSQRFRLVQTLLPQAGYSLMGGSCIAASSRASAARQVSPFAARPTQLSAVGVGG